MTQKDNRESEMENCFISSLYRWWFLKHPYKYTYTYFRRWHMKFTSTLHKIWDQPTTTIKTTFMISQNWKRIEMKTKISYDGCTLNVKPCILIYIQRWAMFVSLFSPAQSPHTPFSHSVSLSFSSSSTFFLDIELLEVCWTGSKREYIFFSILVQCRWGLDYGLV